MSSNNTSQPYAERIFLTAPCQHNADTIRSVQGIKIGAIAAGVRYDNRLDFGMIQASPNTLMHTVTTQSTWPAAPVELVRQLPNKPAAWVLYANSGNANAATGTEGVHRQQALSDALAEDAGCTAPFATGVIGEMLPSDTMIAQVGDLRQALGESPQHYFDFAEAIRTTDTHAKVTSRQCQVQGVTVTITGIAKGAAMIQPNMATMLGFVLTDAKIDHQDLVTLNTQMSAESFNRISVDSDTSTNDCVALVATGAAHMDRAINIAQDGEFYQALAEVYHELAQAIIQDAEGHVKLMYVSVSRARNVQQAELVARSIVNSPLWKTALSAGDPNWGRIVMAMGKSGADIHHDQVKIGINGTIILENGSLHQDYTEEKGQEAMSERQVIIEIDCGHPAGQNGTFYCFGSDLSYEYVRLNADYRT